MEDDCKCYVQKVPYYTDADVWKISCHEWQCSKDRIGDIMYTKFHTTDVDVRRFYTIDVDVQKILY